MPATTTLLGLVTPTQGTLSGTWGDTVNYGITDYVDISVAGTLTLTGDGAVTLANTTGSSSGNSITSTLAGAGTVTAQFSAVRVSGTTTTKVVTGPSYSKSYLVDNASSFAVTFKASGQTGVSISPNEKVYVYYNATDYVKVGGGGITYGAVKTTTYTAVANDGVLTNTTGGAFTVNLPATPLTGTQVFIADSAGTWATNNLTIGRNGSTIEGSGTDLVCDINGVNIQCVYNGTTWDIFAQVGANDTAVVTLNGTQTLTNKTMSGASNTFTNLSLTTAVTGVLPTANGGTNLGGATPFTSGGVVFASSSSVLATGSALYFDGTNLGIGNTSPTSYNNAADNLVIGTSGNNGMTIVSGSTSSGYIMFADGTTGQQQYEGQITYDHTNNFMALSTSGTEKLRLDTSGNLGIGTSTPASYLSGTAKLVVYANANSQHSVLARNDSSGSSASSAFVLNASGNTWGIEMGSSAKNSNALTFQLDYGGTNATKMTLDSAGNLGLGATPAASLFSGANFNIGSSSYLQGTGNTYGLIIANNILLNGSTSWRYINSAAGTQYSQQAGVHYWYNAPSGTAGDAASLTQAMTLTAAGNLCIGTTSSSVKLRVESADADFTGVFRNTNASGYGLQVLTQGSSTNLAFQVRTNAANTDAFQVLDNGNVGIGTNSPQFGIDLRRGSGASAYLLAAGNNNGTTGGILFGQDTSGLSLIYQYGANPITFWTNTTERARITSGGYVKISDDGTYQSSAGTYNEIRQSANDMVLRIHARNASFSDRALIVVAERNTTNNSFEAISYYNSGAGAYKFIVADSGNVTNTNGTYGTISDAKMKKDIVDAGSQWADIKAVRFRKFKMIDDPEQIVQLGVIAQEIEQTSSGLVEQHKDTDKDGNDLGTTTKSVKTSILLMKAAVALQEAMTRIEQLEARLDAANL